ncbi:MAG: FecR domain-containing protein [Candidatus Acidiferrales bacterium]
MKAFWRQIASVLGFSILAFPAGALAAQSPTTFAQIVRLKYVQGDVRFNAGGSKGPDLGKLWEQADANLPIQQGFAIATGTGRAEIEFEDSSVAYLADNSVMLFQVLTSTGGVPATQVELLSGTATFSIHPTVTERFGIDTPTDRLEVDYPEQAYIRVDSFLNGMAVTPEAQGGSGVQQTSGGPLRLKEGQTITYQSGRQVISDEPAPVTAPADWDQWVNAQVERRQMETTAALAASGLSSPIPGLTDLYENGTFFSCGALGKCWRPKPDILAQLSAVAPESRQEALPKPAIVPPSQFSPASPSASQSARTIKNPQLKLLHSEFYSPACGGYATRFDTYWNPITKKKIYRTVYLPNAPLMPWDWAECHAGAFAHSRRSHNFVYVVGKKKHLPPCHWVKAGDAIGCVLRHPGDRKGKPPFNLKYGIIVPPTKHAKRVRIVRVNPSQPIKLLAQAPKEFRGQPVPERPTAPRPEIQVHLMPAVAMAMGNAKTANDRHITYDYAKKAFVRSTGPAAAGHKTKTEVVATFTKTGAAWLRPAAWGGRRSNGFAVGGQRNTGGAPRYAGGRSASRGGGYVSGRAATNRSSASGRDNGRSRASSGRSSGGSDHSGRRAASSSRGGRTGGYSGGGGRSSAGEGSRSGGYSRGSSAGGGGSRGGSNGGGARSSSGGEAARGKTK